jgi:hypothetical protein
MLVCGLCVCACVYDSGRGQGRTYHAIARHYGWALGQLFDEHHHTKAILLEDDMEIAPDFFDYFAAAGGLLYEDTTLLCVSAWNDNGQKVSTRAKSQQQRLLRLLHNSRNAAGVQGRPNSTDSLTDNRWSYLVVCCYCRCLPMVMTITQGKVLDAEQLYRSDFFPGLGWMMTSDLWSELRSKWPKGYWDDWLRLPENRRGRSIIRPEVSRTYTFGEHGSSQGQFYSEFLKPIQLNDAEHAVDWARKDLGAELGKRHYDEALSAAVLAAAPIDANGIMSMGAVKGLKPVGAPLPAGTP